MKRSLRRGFGVLVSLIFLVTPQLIQRASWGKDQPSSDPRAPARSSTDDLEQSAQAPARPSDMPLALLPDPPPLQLPAPRAPSLEAIDAILGRIGGADAALRERARGELLEVRADWTSGLSKRIDSLAERADKSAMRALLEKLRTRAKKSASNDGEDGTTTDYLDLTLTSAEPNSAVWRDLTQILAISRMLRHIGNAEAVRELIRVYVRFGDFMRISTQRELDQLGDRQVAGLWEAARHPAPKISSWAQKRLDLLGKAIPHEAVRTKDPAALADILVALGRTRDPDVGRVLISFAATEKIQVRTAARQGLALLGEAASWQLRDAYQDTTGKAAPRDWTWKRTARELFTEFDRLRTSKVFELFEQGQKAEAHSDFKAMAAAYDQVLAFSPLFEQRERMAAGYLKLAQSLAANDADGAVAALRRAERVAGSDAERHKAESLRYVLEARRLDQAGIVDRGLIDKALALDPESAAAQEALERARSKTEERSSVLRFLLAGCVLLLSVAGAGYVVFTTWRRRRLAPPEASRKPSARAGLSLPLAPEVRPNNDELALTAPLEPEPDERGASTTGDSLPPEIRSKPADAESPPPPNSAAGDKEP